MRYFYEYIPDQYVLNIFSSAMSYHLYGTQSLEKFRDTKFGEVSRTMRRDSLTNVGDQSLRSFTCCICEYYTVLFISKSWKEINNQMVYKLLTRLRGFFTSFCQSVIQLFRYSVTYSIMHVVHYSFILVSPQLEKILIMYSYNDILYKYKYPAWSVIRQQKSLAWLALKGKWRIITGNPKEVSSGLPRCGRSEKSLKSQLWAARWENSEGSPMYLQDVRDLKSYPCYTHLQCERSEE